MALQPALRFRLRYKTPPHAMAMLEAEGESSGDEDEREAMPTARGSCGQFVWPCPREYPSDAAERKWKLLRLPA